jgi:hypothetical protein
MWIKTCAGLGVLAAIAVGTSGCLAVVAGAGAAGAVAYLSGDLKAEESYDIDTVYAATRDALEDLELSVIENKTTRDALSAKVVARDGADKRIEVKLASTTTDTTKISIRIGTFGSETKSRLIYEQIRENLKSS